MLNPPRSPKSHSDLANRGEAERPTARGPERTTSPTQLENSCWNYWRVRLERHGHPVRRLESAGYCVSCLVYSESSFRSAGLNRPMPTVVDHHLDAVLR